MSCALPPELTDAALLSYLDGEADPGIVQHLDRCPFCRQRAVELGNFEKSLTARLFRATCPPALELGEYHMGLLPAPDAGRIASHVDECPHCTADLAVIAAYIAQPDPLPARDVLGPVKERVQVLIARLVSGGRAMGALGTPGPAWAPALAGVRGADAGPMIYEAGETQIMIELQGDRQPASRVSLFGLIQGPEEFDGALVRVWQDDQVIATGAVDEVGNFVLMGLEPGQYLLTIGEAPLEIQIPRLDVPAG